MFYHKEKFGSSEKHFHLILRYFQFILNVKKQVPKRPDLTVLASISIRSPGDQSRQAVEPSSCGSSHSIWKSTWGEVRLYRSNSSPFTIWNHPDRWFLFAAHNTLNTALWAQHYKAPIVTKSSPKAKHITATQLQSFSRKKTAEFQICVKLPRTCSATIILWHRCSTVDGTWQPWSGCCSTQTEGRSWPEDSG